MGGMGLGDGTRLSYATANYRQFDRVITQFKVIGPCIGDLFLSSRSPLPPLWFLSVQVCLCDLKCVTARDSGQAMHREKWRRWFSTCVKDEGEKRERERDVADRNADAAQSLLAPLDDRKLPIEQCGRARSSQPEEDAWCVLRLSQQFLPRGVTITYAWKNETSYYQREFFGQIAVYTYATIDHSQ